MNSVVAFYGSPRKNGFTAQLIDQTLAGAKLAGAKIITYHLNDEGIKGCQGCYWCRSHEGCATKDKLQPVYEEIKNAAGIVVGFPIYFGSISGQGKQWLDRMFPLLKADFSPHYPNKKCVAIYAQGNPNPDICKNKIDENNSFISRFGWNIIDTLLDYGNMQPNYRISRELMARAYENGKKLILG